MKKLYSKPVIEVVYIETTRRILCTSDPISEWGDLFGQVPDLNPDKENMQA